MTDLHLALGTMHLGTRLDDDASFALLDRFVERGGTWLDTADCYAFWQSDSGAGGQSEAVIGRWLAARPGMRERVRIGTKVGVEPRVPGVAGDSQGLAPGTIRSGLQGSLRRLGIDHVDLFWAHREDREVDFGASIQAFGQLADEGLTRRIGLSNHPTWLVERARSIGVAAGLPVMTAVQQSTSYLHPRPDVAVDGQEHPFGLMSPETLDHAAQNPDVELWGYTVMLRGAYDRADRSPGVAFEHPGTVARLAALTSVADDLGVARSQVVLSWLAGGSPAIRPIVGASTLEQLDAAIDGALLRLDDEHRQRLDAAG